MLPVRGHAILIPIWGPATYSSAIEQARLNRTVLLNTYKEMLDALDLHSVVNEWVNTDQVYLGGSMCACSTHGTYLYFMLPGVQVTTTDWDSFQLSIGLGDCEDWLWLPALTGLAIFTGP